MQRKFIEPKFEIDDKKRVICQNHSDYLHFIDPNKDYFEEQFLELKLTCKTCKHYQNDDCYFSRTRLDKILSNGSKRYKCAFCGSPIECMFTIIQKLYFKERYNVELTLTCCNCQEFISKGTYLIETKRKMLAYFFMILFFSYSIWVLYFTLILFHLTIYLLILHGIIVFYINVLLFNRILNLHKGRKYFKKLNKEALNLK
ncbi:MAG: hypothetical protein ACTSYC_06315 [Promethearchaeota archaeon]